MYVLVLFKMGSGAETPELSRQHEAYIDHLIRTNQVLLGGAWGRAAGPFHAAYLLRCTSLDAAAAIASSDPYFRDGVWQPEIVEWDLVGINPGAIEPDLVSR